MKHTIRTNVEFLGQDLKVTAVCWLDASPSANNRGFDLECSTVDLFFGESMVQQYEWEQLAPEVQKAVTDELSNLDATHLGIDTSAWDDVIESNHTPSLPGAYASNGTWVGR